MILTANNVKTITDMRERALALLRQVEKSKGPLYIFHHSRPRAVFLAVEKYKKLCDLLEDYFDSLRAREYEKINKKKINWDSLEDLKKELRV